MCFGAIFGAYAGDRRMLYVYNASVQKYCTFSTQPAWHTRFCYTEGCSELSNLFKEKLIKNVENEVRSRDRVRDPFWKGFWLHFDSILDPLGIHFGPEIVENRFRRPSEDGLEFPSNSEAKKEPDRPDTLSGTKWSPGPGASKTYLGVIPQEASKSA